MVAINFKLNSAWRPDPDHDDMNRDWVGWDDTLSLQTNYEHNRGLWLLGRRAEKERYATFSVDGNVRMVVEIDDIETIPSKALDRPSKRAIVGRVLDGKHPMYPAFMGRPVDGHRNPVTYMPDPGREFKTCACGCGEPLTSTRDFLPGHDQRAIHERIARQWGDTLAFIEWFDATYPTAA